jgi:hypothetical protein
MPLRSARNAPAASARASERTAACGSCIVNAVWQVSRAGGGDRAAHRAPRCACPPAAYRRTRGSPTSAPGLAAHICAGTASPTSALGLPCAHSCRDCLAHICAGTASCTSVQGSTSTRSGRSSAPRARRRRKRRPSSAGAARWRRHWSRQWPTSAGGPPSAQSGGARSPEPFRPARACVGGRPAFQPRPTLRSALLPGCMCARRAFRAMATVRWPFPGFRHALLCSP